MFLPIADAPNPKGVPFATWTLIALNVAAFLLINVPLGAQRADVNDPEFREYVEFLSQHAGGQAELSQVARQTSAYDLFVFKHGYRPAKGSLADLLFAMFLHGGFMHLFGNMLFLWIYGDNVERRLGVVPFVLWYLMTGVAATLFHAAVFSTSDVPLVGASGAISGVLGFYFIWFPKNVVRVLAFLPPILMQVFQIPARFVLGVYLFLDNVLPFFLAGEGGVAHGAHIGGFLAGGAVAWVMDRRGVAARPRDIGAPKIRPVGGGQTVRDALARGEYGEAASEYFALPAASARGVLSPEEAVSLARWLRGNGHSDAALVLLRRVVRDTPRGKGLAEVYALAGFILLEDKREATAAYQYLLTALELGPEAKTAAGIRRELATIEAQQKRHVGRLHRPPSW
jgi:membrane associated rhomboid family serine protease